MKHSFWSERWGDGRIGFHSERVHPGLVRHWPCLEAAGAQGRVLVPLCGKSRDLLWLERRGAEVIGVEFVRKAVDDLAAESGLVLEASSHQGHTVLSGGGLELWVADFFVLGPEQLGQVDAAFDRAALVAVEPRRRPEYARALGRLIRPGGLALLATLEHDLPSGPPHSVGRAEVSALFEADFAVRGLEQADIFEREPRFRQLGATYFTEHLFELRRHR